MVRWEMVLSDSLSLEHCPAFELHDGLLAGIPELVDSCCGMIRIRFVYVVGHGMVMILDLERFFSVFPGHQNLNVSLVTCFAAFGLSTDFDHETETDSFVCQLVTSTCAGPLPHADHVICCVTDFGMKVWSDRSIVIDGVSMILWIDVESYYHEENEIVDGILSLTAVKMSLLT